MITIYKSMESGVEKVNDVISGCWINVVDPTTDEIERLTLLDIPQDFVTSPLDIDERARTEREDDGTMLILLRIPYFQGAKMDVPYTTIPLGIILKDSYLEDQLQLSMQNKEVMELLKYQKSLVYFTTALKSNELMLERLQRSQTLRMYPDDEDLLEDTIIENQQAIEMVNISNNILSSMMDAFASIISNNLNVVMKFLTSVTIVLSIPAIVTSFFGMNVTLPFADHPLAYMIIIGVFLGLMGLVVFIFMKRHWF